MGDPSLSLKVECPVCSKKVFQSELDENSGMCADCYKTQADDLAEGEKVDEDQLDKENLISEQHSNGD